MDIIRMRCGLGNQMFQYAFFRSLLAKGRVVGVDLSYYETHDIWKEEFLLSKVFGNVDICPLDNNIFETEWGRFLELKKDEEYVINWENHPESRKYWGEPLEWTGKFDPNVYLTKDCIFVGTWMTEKYFSNVKDEIRKAFKFPYGEKMLQEMADMLRGKEIVAIQTRMGGDYGGVSYYDVTTVNGFSPQNIVKDGFYENALNYCRENVSKDLHLFVLSCDTELARQQLPILNGNVTFLDKTVFEHYQDWYDMYLISVCRINIIANSSFGWWGAWLNNHPDKLVIAPRKYHKTVDMPDIYPEDWVLI